MQLGESLVAVIFGVGVEILSSIFNLAFCLLFIFLFKQLLKVLKTIGTKIQD